MKRLTHLIVAAVMSATAFSTFTATAQTVGVTDKEILVGGTGALSGPASAYGSLTRSTSGYFKMINEQGGVNGRQIKFLLRDDAYSPPRTVEQTRKLVEQDKVAFIASPQGSLTSITVRNYLNEAKVPQLFVAASLSAFNDPKNYPWTTGSFPSGYIEGREIAAHILKTNPKAKVAILTQNDDGGRDYKRGLVEGLGAEKAKALNEITFELSDPSVDSQVLTLSQTKADALVIVGPPKVTAQAIRKVYDTGWKPAGVYVISYSASVEHVLTPAGPDKSKGVISATFLKDPSDPQWADDPGIKAWVANMNKYNPGLTLDALTRMGWLTAQMTVQVIKQAGNDLSRENLMKQAANLKDLKLDGLLPGVMVNTSATDFSPIDQFQMMRFQGERWTRFGEVIAGGTPAK